MNIIGCILVYLVMFIGWLGISWFTYKNGFHKHSKLFTSSIILFLLSLIYNVAYTSFLGWNFVPASDLEVLLDGIYFVLHVISLGMYCAGLYKLIKG